MAKEASFDIVSKVDLQEVTNAVDQARREIETRFDFKGSKSEIRLEDGQLTLLSDDEYKLSQVYDVLQTKLVKRNVSLKALKPGKVEPAAGGTVRQTVALAQGIDADVAKRITKLIKDSKIKVQAQIQGDQVRVSGKSRDDLQAVIQMLREADLDIPLQFTNYR
ncbi:YajQ family cyclic di-GMP-binding protein [Alicyclobacillus hesperidum subsp. aegles]|uniref:YajQ family cyclic di-GMP-binding protein n=1 Tax=Alicyclobacillus hesperidum TaxID=89784 RepID=UPI00222A15D5|nr:YajQ family cyclic di-GMP-binding protein [Alicyclobacillus hesperidum]GLG00628.1 YajQ family cyclic di-GMP-binding protein [Alicyclobacillus hesperidum subsp. aegles]